MTSLDVYYCFYYNHLAIFLFVFLQIIDFDLPITVKLTVVDVDPGLKGDTAQGNVICFLLEFPWTKSCSGSKF